MWTLAMTLAWVWDRARARVTFSDLFGPFRLPSHITQKTQMGPHTALPSCFAASQAELTIGTITTARLCRALLLVLPAGIFQKW
jgi:hypothetical protein